MDAPFLLAKPNTTGDGSASINHHYRLRPIWNAITILLFRYYSRFASLCAAVGSRRAATQYTKPLQRHIGHGVDIYCYYLLLSICVSLFKLGYDIQYYRKGMASLQPVVSRSAPMCQPRRCRPWRPAHNSRPLIQPQKPGRKANCAKRYHHRPGTRPTPVPNLIRWRASCPWGVIWDRGAFQQRLSPKIHSRRSWAGRRARGRCRSSHSTRRSNKPANKTEKKQRQKTNKLGQW